MNGRKGHAIGVHSADMLVVLAQAEGSVKILRDRPQMPNLRALRLVVPALHRDRRQPVQHLPAIHRAEIGLAGSVTQIAPGTGTSRQLRARVPTRGEEKNAAGGADGEAVVADGTTVLVERIAPDKRTCIICLSPSSGSKTVIPCGEVISTADNRATIGRGCVVVAPANRCAICGVLDGVG